MEGLIRLISTLAFLFISIVSFSQTSIYGGVWSIEKNPRPYFYFGTGKTYGSNFTYSPVLGIGVNSENKVSGMIGFDTEFGYGELQPLAGFGVEMFGWEQVYQDFMPNFRVGLKYKRVRFLSSMNWDFNKIETKLGPALRPVSKLTYGLFYDFK